MSRRERWRNRTGFASRVTDPRERVLTGVASVTARLAAPFVGAARHEEAPSRVLVLRVDRIGDVVMSLPAIADLRGTGRLELVALSWLTGTKGGTMEHPDLTWQLLRLDLSAKTPPSRTWAGYMGTNADGQYYPMKGETRH